MKLVVASQRVDEITAYGERRDALDQRWSRLFLQLGVALAPLPNAPETAQELLQRLCPDGILLTGGNTPLVYGGHAPERDAIDTMLIDYACQHSVPLLGVCRGMQSLVLALGGTLRPVDGHVAADHALTGTWARECVNSYHGFAIEQLPAALEPLAYAPDGTVEAVRHRTLPFCGIFWHPERETPTCAADIALLRTHFGWE